MRNVETMPVTRNDQDNRRFEGKRRRVFAGIMAKQLSLAGYLDGKRRLVRDFLDYLHAKAQFGDAVEEFHNLFKRFLAASVDRRCLRLLFDAYDEPDLGANWVTVDLDKVERRVREAGPFTIELDDEDFDVVLCTGLDRISRPERLIAEIRRVLKQSGQMWVQVPLNAPYFPANDLTQTEYWRITPDGLRVFLAEFDEILCGVYPQGGSVFRVGSFFYGLKRADAPEDLKGLEASSSASIS